nr:ATP synthase F0 subunit 8 [Kikihia sp. 'murihikua']
MPQMSPLNWLLLFIYFITMIVIIMFMYFTCLLKSDMTVNKKLMDSVIWMW